MLKHFWIGLCCLWCWLLPFTLLHAEDFSINDLPKITSQLDTAEKSLPKISSDTKQLEALQTQAITLQESAQHCIDQFTQQQTLAQQALDSLGESSTTESADVKAQRKQLETQKQQVDSTLAQCRLLSLRAQTLNNDTQKASQGILQEQLFTKSASLWEHTYTLLRYPEHWKSDILTLIQAFTQLFSHWQDILLALFYGFIFALLTFIWSINQRRHLSNETHELHTTSPTLTILWRSVLHSLPYIVFAAITAISLNIFASTIRELQSIFIMLFVYHISMAVLRSLLRTSNKVEGILAIDKKTSREINIEAKLVLMTTLTAIIFHWSALDFSQIQTLHADNNLVGLIRISCASIIGFALTRLVWLAARHIVFLRRVRLPIVVTLISLIAVVSAWLGYANFTVFLFQGTFGSLLIFLLTWLLLQIPSEILDGLDEGRALWQQNIRHRLNLQANELVPGLLWLRISHTVIVLSIIATLLLYLWGMSEQNLKYLLLRLVNGIDIGSFTLEPLRIISGVLVMAALIGLSHVFKQYIAETWLRHTTLTRGAREASTTIFGYIGIILAVLIGLSIAGIEFKNLAIIAGALSVGIGFGLQNIVNNFVSGLILLFERPISRGDWIRVGEAEGFVRNISIRSTTIQTFDHSDIIVPNSEIISGQVINMMLNDNYGRIIIPIGVAYGSDTDLVMQLLRKTATDHPSIVKNRPDMKISVFFMGFGDNALNFELRCFVHDISSRLATLSDLNMAIDKLFREHDVEMPFPQRTIHLSNADGELPIKILSNTSKSTDLS